MIIRKRLTKVVESELAREYCSVASQEKEGSESAALAHSLKPRVGNTGVTLRHNSSAGCASTAEYHKRPSGKNRARIGRQILRADRALSIVYGIAE
jgi:hypothetical protein